MITLGIDEAGRGPLLGPMVMAAVTLDKKTASALRRAGVDDSKRWTGDDAHTERTRLANVIRERASYFAIAIIDVRTIDEWVDKGGLNRLEQTVAHRMISTAPSTDRVVCDGKRLFGPLQTHFPHLRAEDGADARHTAVAAASILAKTRRDELWHLIAARYRHDFGELCDRGGGYVNQATRNLVRAYVQKHGRMPPEARRSWPWDFVSDLLPVNAAASESTPQLGLGL